MQSLIKRAAALDLLKEAQLLRLDAENKKKRQDRWARRLKEASFYGGMATLLSIL
jgi:hypothetical protein